MRHLATLTLLACMAFVVACGERGNGTEVAGRSPTAEGTSEGRPRTPTPTDATPEATGTPSPQPRTPPAVTVRPAFPSLARFERPIAMVEVPGEGVVLLATQGGEVFVFEKSAEVTTVEVALDWRSRTRREGNEEGLLGLALDPEFSSRRFVYLYYTAAGGARRSVVARFEVRGSGSGLRIEPASEQILLEVPQPYSNHNGGALAFGPDGLLYIALGDGGGQGDPQGNGQDLGTLLGSILRLDVRSFPYRVPLDNPFVGRPGVRGEIWAYGFRNPWRFSFDRRTGALWAGDVGQNSWEEVNVVTKGGNYGWNVMEGRACFRPLQGCETDGLVEPVAVYPTGDRNCAVTGGYVYRGAEVPMLEGFYLYADYCSGRIWALDADAALAGATVSADLVADTDLAIASFAEDADGELYVLAFDGHVYRLALP